MQPQINFSSLMCQSYWHDELNLYIYNQHQNYFSALFLMSLIICINFMSYADTKRSIHEVFTQQVQQTNAKGKS